MRQFLEVEAELGSDNELNDNAVKRINKDDAEENEDGQDADLQGFVVNDGNSDVGDEAGMMSKVQEDRQKDEK